MTAKPLVWLPYPVTDFSGKLPVDLTYELYEGAHPPPASLDEVEFYVAPYTFDQAPAKIIEQMPNLRVVQVLTAGVDHVAPFVDNGITLCNAKGVHDASTAELAVALTLASLRGFADFVRGMDRSEWRHARYPSLADRRLAIVGFGSIGRAVAKRLEPFEVDVVGVTRGNRADTISLDDFLLRIGSFDVVILTVPLTSETQHLVDAGFIRKMKPGGLLVNVARGGVVDIAALESALRAGHIRAALDVLDNEPLPADDPLWSAPNLIITPHVGGNTTAFLPRAMKLIVSQLHRYAAGEPLANVL